MNEILLRAATLWVSLRARISGQSGAVATEYVLLLTLIAITIIIAASAFGVAVADKLQSGADCVNTLPVC